MKLEIGLLKSQYLKTKIFVNSKIQPLNHTNLITPNYQGSLIYTNLWINSQTISYLLTHTGVPKATHPRWWCWTTSSLACKTSSWASGTKWTPTVSLKTSTFTTANRPHAWSAAASPIDTTSTQSPISSWATWSDSIRWVRFAVPTSTARHSALIFWVFLIKSHTATCMLSRYWIFTSMTRLPIYLLPNNVRGLTKMSGRLLAICLRVWIKMGRIKI